MTRLTEEMVIARSRQSDLASIKKLNCWGSALSDVSIVKRMQGVEVLALSVNNITSLQDFENCHNLQELYLRKNNIQDINEIAYLQNLSNLKFLWLEENPCCENVGPNYRAIVLRALPNLKKLDNVDVTPEEVEEAQRQPIVRQDVYEDAREHQPQQQQQQQQQQLQQQQRRSQSPIKELKDSNTDNNNAIEEPITEQVIKTTEQPTSPPALQRTPSSQDFSPQEQIHPTSPKYNNREHRMSYHQYDRSPVSEHGSPTSGATTGGGGGGGGSSIGGDVGGSGYRERGPIPPSISTQSMKEYYQSDYQKPPHPSQYRHSQFDLTEWDEQQHPPNQYNGGSQSGNTPQRRSAGTEREMNERFGYRNGNARDRDDWEENERSKRRPDGRFSDSASVVSSAVLNHYAGYHRRPVNRSSNLLSATLCLVKELDYPSLEVVEHAVRCRIDELSAE